MQSQEARGGAEQRFWNLLANKVCFSHPLLGKECEDVRPGRLTLEYVLIRGGDQPNGNQQEMKKWLKASPAT